MQKVSFALEETKVINFKEILGPQDIELISKICDYDCDKLIASDLFKASSEIMEHAFGKNSVNTNVINNYDLNVKGLRLLRAVASYNVLNKRRAAYGLDTHEDYEEYITTGAVIKENFLPEQEHSQIKNLVNEYVEKYPHACIGKKSLPGLVFNMKQNKKYQDIMNMCTATESNPNRELNAKVINHTHRDYQHDLHIDKIYPTIKVWYYINDTLIEHGPTYFVKGSHKNTKQKLKWLYKKSLAVSHPSNYFEDYGDWFWSRFRPGLENEQINSELNKQGFEKQTPLVFKENTLIVLDTSAFHRRGEANSNTLRVSLRDVAPRSSINNLANSIGLGVIT